MDGAPRPAELHVQDGLRRAKHRATVIGGRGHKDGAKPRFTDDPAEYETAVKAFIGLCMREVPVIPLNQPIHDVAMQKNISGYQFWFHREPDFRQFAKG